MDRVTKIIATLGPAVQDPEAVHHLVRAGMDVARLNFSHGTYETHRQFSEWVHAAADAEDQAVGILQDIQGPKIRVGRFPDASIELEEGDGVRLVPGSGMAARGEIHIEHLDRAVGLKPGDIVLLADGLIVLDIDRVDNAVWARVRTAGVLADRKGVAFPGITLDLPPITDKDRRDLEFGQELGVDMVAASFVSSGTDIDEVKALAGGLPVIAKIERVVGYRALDDILASADGAMVARGDLGVELRLEVLPRVQKEIVSRTNADGGISITATEMLESMTNSPRPTRAEATDVANAVLDGTDAVMLSGETAIGKFPIRALETMHSICYEAEKALHDGIDTPLFLGHEAPFPSAVTRAAVEVARNLDIGTIVGFTESGSTARLLSKYRPRARIVAFTAIERTFRQMALYRGVTPHRFERRDHTDDMITEAEEVLLEEGVCKQGDRVVMVAGIPPNQGETTNLLKIHEVGMTTSGLPDRK